MPKRVLEDYYILQIAYLDPGCRKEPEKEFVEPYFLDVHMAEELPSIGDYKSIGLEVKPPTVWRYFVKADEDVLERFIERNGLWGTDPRRAEDELFRNSFALNKKYYASLGEKKAFVVSHSKDMIVLEIVGYAEQVVKYY